MTVTPSFTSVDVTALCLYANALEFFVSSFININIVTLCSKLDLSKGSIRVLLYSKHVQATGNDADVALSCLIITAPHRLIL